MSKTKSLYRLATTDLPTLVPTHPRPLLPLHPPPPHRWLYPPVLPSPTRLPAPEHLRERYELTTHIVPAAYPRSTPFVPEPPPPARSPDVPPTKEERRADVLRVVEDVLEVSTKFSRLPEYPGDRDGRLLWNVVSRYRRKGLRLEEMKNRKCLTLLFFHANGFPKEVSMSLHRTQYIRRSAVDERSGSRSCHTF